MDVCARVRVIGAVIAAAVSSSAMGEGFYVGVNGGGSNYDVSGSDLGQSIYAPAPQDVVPSFNPYSRWSTYGYAGSFVPNSAAIVSGTTAIPCSILACPAPVLAPLAPTSESLDKSGTAFKVDVGYRFNPFFAAELSYADLGSVSYEATYNLPTSGTQTLALRQSGDVEVDGLGVSLLGSYPFTPQWSVFLRGGYFFGDAQVTMRMNNLGGPSPNYSADNAFASGGVDYSFAERWGVRLEYQRYFDAGGQALRRESDVDTWSLGLQYRL